MRVLVCGGRNYSDRTNVFRTLDALIPPADMIIEGGANGADALAREWAHDGGVPCLTHSANWRAYGRRAGPIRNREMLERWKPDVVIAFPGGHGTNDMVRAALAAKVEVREVPE